MKVVARAVIGFFSSFTLCCSIWGAASSSQWYYPAELLTLIKNTRSTTSDSTLRDQLFLVLNLPHISREKERKPDLLCQELGQEMIPSCMTGSDSTYRPLSFDYSQARVYLFNQVNARETSQDTLEIDDYYCENPKEVDLARIDGRSIPPGTGMNTEHVWPQSKFNQHALGAVQGIRAIGEMKTNLHILVPTTSSLNSLRSSYPFGNVKELHSSSQHTKCQQGDQRFSILGYRAADRAIVFQPPVDRKGDVARIVFYFAVKYNVAMVDEIEEQTLRQWHQEDPVDDRERQRNEAIAKIQQGRNPFIDYPQLVGLIKNF